MSELTNKKYASDADKIFGVLIEIFKSGGSVNVDRSGIKAEWKGSSPKQASFWNHELENFSDVSKDIILGSRKDWAKDRREISVGMEIENGWAKKIAAVEILERRKIGSGHIFDLEKESDRQEFIKFFGQSYGVILDDPNPEKRAALGGLLSELGIGRGKIMIVEVGVGKEIDYRHYLAGSIWVDMNVDVSEDILSDALFTAIKVRSIRQTGLKEYKQGFYSACAVRQAYEQSESIPEISKRFNLTEGLIQNWISAMEEKSNKSHFKKPASPAQINFVNDILGDMPELEKGLPKDWSNDSQGVSKFLNLIKDEQLSWRHRRKNIDIGFDLRERIGKGEALGIACAGLKISREFSVELLEEDIRVTIRRLEDEISRVLEKEIKLIFD